jgi:hypothetical protein
MTLCVILFFCDFSKEAYVKATEPLIVLLLNLNQLDSSNKLIETKVFHVSIYAE